MAGDNICNWGSIVKHFGRSWNDANWFEQVAFEIRVTDVGPLKLRCWDKVIPANTGYISDVVVMSIFPWKCITGKSNRPENGCAKVNVCFWFVIGYSEDALMIPAGFCGICDAVKPESHSGTDEPLNFKKVKTGAAVDRNIVVLAGLKEGDFVFKGLSKNILRKKDTWAEAAAWADPEWAAATKFVEAAAEAA